MELKTLSGGYTLKSDRYNYWFEKTLKNGNKKLVGGYYKSINEALKALAEMRIKSSEADCLKWYLTEMQSVKAEIDAIIDAFIPF